VDQVGPAARQRCGRIRQQALRREIDGADLADRPMDVLGELGGQGQQLLGDPCHPRRAEGGGLVVDGQAQLAVDGDEPQVEIVVVLVLVEIQYPLIFIGCSQLMA